MIEKKILDFEVESQKKPSVVYTTGEAKIDEKILVHVIAQSHLDLMWKWDRYDIRDMIYNTLKGHVDKLSRNPDYTYSQSQIFLYEYVLKHFPVLFEEIRKIVAEGRWEIVGGQWVEPDSNLLDEESTVRQFLYGQKFIKKHFGLYARTAWSPDGFGHNPNLPQIFSGAGINFFVHKRPRQKFLDLPATPYLWKGVDGTVITALCSNNKGNGLPRDSEGHIHDCSETEFVYMENKKLGISDLWGPLGLGDTGGVNDYDEVPLNIHPNIKFKFSTPQEFYKKIEAKMDLLPVSDAEPNQEFPACYTTHADIKKLHRQCEQKIEQAESLSAIAYTLGMRYDSERIEEAWKYVLYNEFHDGVTGTGLDRVHEQSGKDYGYALYSSSSILERAAGFRRASMANLLEDETTGMDIVNNEFEIDFGKYEIKTIILSNKKK